MHPHANPKKANALWFAGVCDELYQKIALWNQCYWTGGEVHSTRLWMDPKIGQPVPKPTRMAHRVPLREIELDHLLRIVEALRPGTPLLEELQQVRKIWKYAKPVKGYVFSCGYWSRVPLPHGMHRSITLAFYPEHVKEMVDILQEAKTGQKPIKPDGKDIFEE